MRWEGVNKEEREGEWGNEEEGREDGRLDKARDVCRVLATSSLSTHSPYPSLNKFHFPPTNFSSTLPGGNIRHPTVASHVGFDLQRPTLPFLHPSRRASQPPKASPHPRITHSCSLPPPLSLFLSFLLAKEMQLNLQTAEYGFMEMNVTDSAFFAEKRRQGYDI